MKVACYVLDGNGKSRLTVPAMASGIGRVGDVPVLTTSEAAAKDCDAAVFWGYVESCQNIMNHYIAAGKSAVYIDMGYWGREGGNAHFKISVNARHPTAYFQNVKHDDKRARLFNLQIKPWQQQTDGHILIAGMGAKAAWAEKLEPVQSFEIGVIEQLQVLTDRPIVYRPKPSWKQAKPIAGVRYSPPEEPFTDALRGCYAVVSHHSNVAVDAAIDGIPVFVWDGVATKMGTRLLHSIDEPLKPEGREQWVNDIAYQQWTVAEMQSGAVWRHLKDEGLV